MLKLSAEEIIRKLKSTNEQDNEEALNDLYGCLQQPVARFILRNKGNSQDVDDIFHDGLIAFYKLAKQDKLNKDLNIEAYVFTICRNMWAKKLMKAPGELELDDRFHSIPVEEISVQTIFSKERSDLLDKIISQLGEECNKIIRMYYYQRIRMREIANLLNFSSEQMAKNKKSGCMKKLRAVVLASPYIQDLLR